MKRTNTALLFGFLLSLSSPLAALPQREFVKIIQPSHEWSSNSSFLWELRTHWSTVYILGSVHIAPDYIFPLPEVIEESFDKSPVLIVECDITDPAVIEYINGNLLRMTILGKDESLYDYADQDLLERLSLILEGYGIPLKTVAGMKPWVIEMMLVQLELQRLGYNTELGVDLYFLQKAHQTGKTVRSLETAEEQVALLAGGTIREQLLSLESSLVDFESFGRTMEEIFAFWLSGDIEGLESLAFQPILESAEYRDVYRRLYLDRNEAWLDAVQECIFDKGTYFIIVGAGHLVGPGSLIDLLEQQGYRLSRL